MEWNYFFFEVEPKRRLTKPDEEEQRGAGRRPAAHARGPYLCEPGRVADEDGK